MNRDPRFYRTFTFPGFRWAYNGDATVISQNNPADSKNYVLWSYVWYTDKMMLVTQRVVVTMLLTTSLIVKLVFMFAKER